MQRISFLGMEFGFSQSDSAPHAGTRSVGVELLECVQEQDGGTTETVSEAPGAYGGCSGGHTAGAAPYETASTLTPWPSPEVGVAERHAAGPSHSSLPPNLHPVVRPFIPSGRSAPGTGLQARCGLHGCLRQGLGGHVQWACSVGGLDGSPTTLAYQLPRVAGSTPGLETSQETLTRRARTGPYGQHCDRCVHQPTRWSTLPSHVTTRPSPPPLESEASEVASRHSYSGLAQPDSRRAVMSCAPRRVETPSPDGPADLQRFGLAQVDLFASLETSHCQLFYSLPEGTLGTDALAHSWSRGLRKYAFPPVSLLAQTLCKVREEEEQILLVAPYWPILGSQSWCSSWQPLPGRFLWWRIYCLRDGAPCGTRVQTFGNFMSGPWTGRRGSKWPTPRGSLHHHFGDNSVYETRLRLEVEPVRRMVLFSQRRPREVPDQSHTIPFCSNGWSEDCLPPSLTPMWLRLLPTTTPWMGSWWGSMTRSSGFLGEREGWILHGPPLYPLGTCL